MTQAIVCGLIVVVVGCAGDATFPSMGNGSAASASASGQGGGATSGSGGASASSGGGVTGDGGGGMLPGSGGTGGGPPGKLCPAKGDAWQLVLPAKLTYYIALTPGATLLAGTTSKVPDNAVTVHRSIDGGLSWTNSSTVFNQASLRGVVVPSASRIVVGTGWQPWPNGIWYSVDDGKSWSKTQPQGTLGPGTNVTALELSPWKDLYAGTEGAMSWRSTDEGKTWTSIGHQGAQMQAFAFGAPGVVYAGGLVPGGGQVDISKDYGKTWKPIFVSSNGVIALARTPKGALFASVKLKGLYRSTDDGNTWNKVASGPTDTLVGAVAVSPSGEVYASASSGVFRSNDDGATWIDVSKGIALPGSLGMYAFAPDGSIYLGSSAGMLNDNYISPSTTSTSPHLEA
jgi:hypothetical protein